MVVFWHRGLRRVAPMKGATPACASLPTMTLCHLVQGCVGLKRIFSNAWSLFDGRAKPCCGVLAWRTATRRLGQGNHGRPSTPIHHGLKPSRTGVREGKTAHLKLMQLARSRREASSWCCGIVRSGPPASVRQRPKEPQMPAAALRPTPTSSHLVQWCPRVRWSCECR